MNLYTLMRQGQEPRPTTGQHPGMPADFVPPPNPTKMEPQCEAVIKAPVRMDGNTLVIGDKATGGESVDAVVSGMAITANEDNESCVYARNGAQLQIRNSILNKADGACIPVKSDTPGPMLRGINSLVLANGPGTEIRVEHCQLTAEHEYVNDERLNSSHGAFSVFQGKTYLKDVVIRLNGSFAHGVYDTLFGTIYLENSTVETFGECASALATDNPGGDIFAKNCVVHTHGPASAGIYCDGGSTISFTNGHLESDIDAGAIACNNGYVRIENATVKGVYAARMWQPVTAPAHMEFVRCNLIATENSAFVFDGGNGSVIFDHCTISAQEDKCLVISRRCYNNYDACGRGTVMFKGCSLVGDIGAADDCSMDVTLVNTTITGRAHQIDLTVSYDSWYIFTGDTKLQRLKVADLACLCSTVPCTITYQPEGSTISGTHMLQGGAKLIPQM